MAVTIQCPPQDLLRRLLLGELSPFELESLSAHVLKCDQCAAVLNEMRTSDDLLQSLRGADTVVALDTRVQTLIDQMSRLPRETGGATETGVSAPAARATTVTYPNAGAQGASEHAFLSPPERPDELGRLGSYRVLKLLGKGGMGAVYLAEDTQLERLVALKVMRPELAANPESRHRFVREAKATAKLKDDHIVAIYQVGEHNGVPFLAMEYLRGESLEQWLARGKTLNVGQLLRVARDIARGLAAAHAKGLIHRDIKPANLWLEAPQGRVKILDFGLARGDNDDMQLTQTGAVLGTPTYMSPEQGRGEPADARSDLFSLGCVLYRLCTGRLPFNGKTVMAILHALATNNPTPVAEVNPKIPSEVAELTMRLLAKPREYRPASAQAVLQELQAILQQNAQPARPEAQPETAQLDAQPARPKVPAETTQRITPPRPNVPTASAPPRRSIPWKKLAMGLVVPLCVVLAAQVVIRIRNKDGSETKIEVPKDSEVIVEDKGKVVIKVPDEKAKAKPAVVGNPQRRLAEMVLNHGGTLTVQTAKEGINVAAIKDLPKEPFLVRSIKADSKPIPDQAFEAFEGAYDIPALVLSVADEAGLRHLRDVAVQQITLTGEKLNGDECVKNLGERPDLGQLSMNGCSLSDAAVPHLLKMKQLRGIYHTSGSTLTDEGIKALASHPTLQYVAIYPTSPKAAALLNQLPFLRHIDVNNVDDADVTTLSRLTRPAVVVPYGNLSDDAARRLQKALPNAVILHGAIPPSDAERAAFQWALDHKAQFGGFLSWNVPIKEVPTSAISLGPLDMPVDLRTGASHLRGIRCVHSLKWLGPNNADEEAEHIAALDSLLGLWLGRTPLTAKGMERLTALKRLESLFLMNIPTLTPEALSYVSKFEQLSGMAINGSPVTDSGLAELAKAKGLQDLLLEWCSGPLTGAGFKHLASLPLLRHLNLNNTFLDASSVGSLKLLTSLRVLDVRQTQLGAADIAELRKALPKCAIVWDGGLIVPGVEGEREAKQP
jgi:serine/threonine protein kinase